LPGFASRLLQIMEALLRNLAQGIRIEPLRPRRHRHLVKRCFGFFLLCSLELKESPLIAGLGLILGGQRAMILGQRHLAGGETGQHGRENREQHRSRAMDDVPEGLAWRRVSTGGRRLRHLGGRQLHKQHPFRQRRRQAILHVISGF